MGPIYSYHPASDIVFPHNLCLWWILPRRKEICWKYLDITKKWKSWLSHNTLRIQSHSAWWLQNDSGLLQNIQALCRKRPWTNDEHRQTEKHWGSLPTIGDYKSIPIIRQLDFRISYTRKHNDHTNDLGQIIPFLLYYNRIGSLLLLSAIVTDGLNYYSNTLDWTNLHKNRTLAKLY